MELEPGFEERIDSFLPAFGRVDGRRENRVGCENSVDRRLADDSGDERETGRKRVVGHRDAEGAECKSRQVIAPCDHYLAYDSAS